MKFRTRKWVKPGDLNPNGGLFGGSLLKWIDEEAAIYAICQLDNTRVVTKYISEIDFVNPAKEGDIIEMGIETIYYGTTSLTLRCLVRNKLTQERLLAIEKIVFVNLDENGIPLPHGKMSENYPHDQLSPVQKVQSISRYEALYISAPVS